MIIQKTPVAPVGLAGGGDPEAAAVDQALANVGIDPRVGMLSMGSTAVATPLPVEPAMEPVMENDAPVVGLAEFQRRIGAEGSEAFGPVAPAEGPPSDPAMVTVLVQTAMQRMGEGAAEAWAKMDGDVVTVKWRFKPAAEQLAEAPQAIQDMPRGKK